MSDLKIDFSNTKVAKFYSDMNAKLGAVEIDASNTEQDSNQSQSTSAEVPNHSVDTKEDAAPQNVETSK